MNKHFDNNYDYPDGDVREALQHELALFEASFGKFKPYERKGLREWVACGNSVFDNPYYLYDDSGWPMDFVSAKRTAALLAAENKNNKFRYTVSSVDSPKDGLFDSLVQF